MRKSSRARLPWKTTNVQVRRIDVRYAGVDSDGVASVGPVQDLESGSGSRKGQKAPQNNFCGFRCEVIYATFM